MSDAIQCYRFETPAGGFVLHKVLVNGVKYSAWYDAMGTCQSAERVTRDFKNYNVPLGVQVQLAARLSVIGKRYVTV